MTAEIGSRLVRTTRRSPDPGQKPWASWARPQLRHAVEIAARITARDQRIALAPELYRLWFQPIVTSPHDAPAPLRPLAGSYRAAHAGSARRREVDGLATVCRNDVIGADGWWRTWGTSWQPLRSRQESVRLVLTPRPDCAVDVVRVLTTVLLNVREPWLLACATDPRRLRRSGAAVLNIADPSLLPASTIAALRSLLLPVTPPLCLPLQPGIALADTPDNGLGFGEHRCHLISLALRHRGARRAPLRAIAETFAAHGIDPAQPHVSTGRG